jgi:hypothetical protein
MKTIAAFSKPEEAHLARSRLEGSGIRAHVRDEHTIGLYWLYSNALGGVRLDVADEDVERAKEVLGLPPTDAGLLCCPRCGSSDTRMREFGLFTAVCVGLGFVLPSMVRRADCRACGHFFKVARTSDMPTPSAP